MIHVRFVDNELDGRGVKFEITRSLDPNEVEGGLEDLKKGQSEDNKIWADNLRKAEERYIVGGGSLLIG